MCRCHDHRSLEGIEAIGADEIQWQRGHKYLTLVYQIDKDCRRLLWAGKDRTAKTLLRFFRMLGKARSARLGFVCSDMWKPYLKMIAKKAPQAIHVLDRFHIMAKMNKAIDEVRAAEVKRLERDGYEPVLKNSRWCLLKREENLTDKQAVKLSELLQYNLQSIRSRLMREDFQRFWEFRSGSKMGPSREPDRSISARLPSLNARWTRWSAMWRASVTCRSMDLLQSFDRVEDSPLVQRRLRAGLFP